MSKKKILVVDDEKLIVKGIRFSLEQDDMEVDCAYDGEEALQYAKNCEYDLVLLDVMLPKMDGFQVCQAIREFSDMPIVMLTAKSEDMDKILGLEYGADDYITKPFAIEELLARIRVVFKKRGGLAQRTRKMTVKGVTIDTDRYEVTCGGELVELNHREYELVRILMENKNIVMNRQQLMNSVCGYDYMGETNIIDVYVRHIRSKIDNRFGFRFITTVRGVGYAVKEE